MLRRFFERLERQESNYVFLFWTASAMVLLNPFLDDLEIGQVIGNILVTLVIMACLYVNRHSRWFRLLQISTGLAVSAIWFRLFKQSDLQTGPDLIANLFMILFFTWITIRLIHTIMISSRVTPNVIYGSISGYLLIGFTGAAWAATIEYIVPNSFVFPEQSIPTFQGFIYYSYITLSTLGYGDVLPVTGPAQSLSIFLSTVGQMYLTILVAFLVGKYINDNTLPPSK